MKPALPSTAPRDRLLDEAVAVLHARGESVAVVQLVHAWAASGVPSSRARLAEGRAFQRLCLLDRAMARAQEAFGAAVGAHDSGPEHLEARWLMVDVYLDRGWPLKARKLLTALRDEGHDVDAAWARSLEEPPRPENHAREAEREADPQRLLALAEAFLRAGSFLRATGLLERVRRLQPANTRAHDLLWALGGEFGGGDVDALVRRAKAFAAASSLAAPSDEAEHTETLGADIRDAVAHDDEAVRFPALFKYEGGPSDRTDTDGGDVTAASALLGGVAVSLPSEAGRGDTQIMLVIRPGEDAAASASRAAHRRRADAEDAAPVDLRAWQRSMGMGDSDLDGMTDKRLEEEDIERVMVTRAEAPLPEPSEPPDTVAPIEVLELVPQPPAAPVVSGPPAPLAAANGGPPPPAASPPGGQPMVRQPGVVEVPASPEPASGRGRSGRSLLWAGLSFAGVLGVGLAVLVGVGSRGGSDAAERVELAMQTEDYARLLEEEGRLERALEEPGAEAALAGVRLALWADFNGDPTRMTAVRALLDRPENVDLHALAVLRAATALAQEDVAGASAALGREVPQSDEERLLFARIAATGGDAERALAHLDAITATDALRYQLGRARVLADLGRHEEAVALVDGVLAAHPGDFSAEVLRLELTDVPAAVAPKAADLLSRSRALRSSGAPIAPRLEGRIHAAYARALVALGAPPDEVRDMISSGLAHDGTNPDLLYLLAADDTARGRLTTALADLQVILAGRRGHVAARTASVLVLLDLDRVDAALEVVAGFGTDARSASASAASRALVEAAGRGGAVDDGALDAGAVSRWARALEAAQANSPDAAKAAAEAVDALTASNDPFERRLLPRARALRATLSGTSDPAALGREVIDTSPDDPYVHVLVARMYEAAGQRARAAVHFDRAAELGPELGLAWYEKGRFYMDAGDNFLRTGAAWRNYLSLAPTGPRATRAEDTLAVR